MKISTKGRYGLEAMVDLAQHVSEGCVSLKSISDRCGITEAYILQIFLKLRRAGIVDSVRGAQGGYRLSRDPSLITVGHVITALEGPLAPVACISGDKENHCEQYNHCSTRNLWENILHTLNDIAFSVTLGDLVSCYNRLIQKNSDLEYYI